MAEQFPPGSITIEVIERFQAECERCGWHTREFSGGDRALRQIEHLSRLHMNVCPNPKIRSGGTTDCGCWTYEVSPGESTGDKEKTCPVHGPTTIVKMNVDEPTPWGTKRWVHAFAWDGEE